MNHWSGLGISPAAFLLPRAQHLNTFWPVIACDQYTSQKEIWQQVDQEIGPRPSTLRLIIPEAFLEETAQRTKQVEQAMTDYLKEGLFEQLPEGFLLVERQTQSGRRLGLVTVIDLEAYDYQEGSSPLIRATERTVLSRIPPRLLLRQMAQLELSHVLLLYYDPQETLLGPLIEKQERLTPLYDLPLLMQGGQIRAFLLNGEGELSHLHSTLSRIKAELLPGEPLFLVGDGNHSLAAAKANWEQKKKGLSQDAQQNHPARFAMVELVNLLSPALRFEPIHRVVFGKDQDSVLKALSALEPEQDARHPDITLLTEKGDLPLRLRQTGGRLVTAAVQELLDQAGFEMDYVHGLEATRKVAAANHGVGILMPEFQKPQLFPTVMQDGRLPRKTFSMGEANEKRFYLEARWIVTPQEEETAK